MPLNYKTIGSDSPQSIAIKFYGDRSKGALIVSVNPGLKYVGEPVTTSQILIAGQEIIIPDQVDPTPSETPEVQKTVSLFDRTPRTVAAADEDEVTLVIKGRSFRVFDNLSIKFDYDKIANEFSFDAPFDPGVPEYRDAFKPIYQSTDLYIGGELVIVGQSWANPALTSSSNTVKVTGYSKTGNIDRTAIVAPFEFDEGTTFAALITDIASRSGLAVVIDPRASEAAAKPFEKRIEFSPSEKAGSKLATLARQRGLILSPTFNGRILVSKPVTEAETVQAFVSGELPVLSFLPTYNADALSTSYIGYAPGTPDEASEANNFSLNGYPQPGILPRIRGITPSDADNQNIEDAVRAERGRAFGDWFKASLTVAGWRDKNGNLYQPNTLVTARAPRSMIYEDTTFFIRAVTLNKSSNRKSAKIDLILPEAYSGRDLKITV